MKSKIKNKKKRNIFFIIYKKKITHYINLIFFIKNSDIFLYHIIYRA